jgi:hypothetical protein
MILDGLSLIRDDDRDEFRPLTVAALHIDVRTCAERGQFLTGLNWIHDFH